MSHIHKIQLQLLTEYLSWLSGPAADATRVTLRGKGTPRIIISWFLNTWKRYTSVSFVTHRKTQKGFTSKMAQLLHSTRRICSAACAMGRYIESGNQEFM